MADTIENKVDGAGIAAEQLANAIVAIDAGIKALRATRLNEKALEILIQHASPSITVNGRQEGRVSIREVRAVLSGLDSLRSTYLKKEK